jgi:hypothetical protein
MLPGFRERVSEVNEKSKGAVLAEINATIKEQIALANKELAAPDNLSVGETKKLIVSLCNDLKTMYPSREFVLANVSSQRNEFTDTYELKLGARTIFVLTNAFGKYFFRIT